MRCPLAVCAAARPGRAARAPTPDAPSPDRASPAYTGHAAELFDDGDRADRGGLPAGPGRQPPATDAALRERVQTATPSCARASVTGDREGGGPRAAPGSWRFIRSERLAGKRTARRRLHARRRARATRRRDREGASRRALVGQARSSSFASSPTPGAPGEARPPLPPGRRTRPTSARRRRSRPRCLQQVHWRGRGAKRSSCQRGRRDQEPQGDRADAHRLPPGGRDAARSSATRSAPGMTTVDIDRIVHEDTLSPGRAARAAQLQGLPEERLHERQRDRLPRHPGRRRCSRTATSSTST